MCFCLLLFVFRVPLCGALCFCTLLSFAVLCFALICLALLGDELQRACPLSGLGFAFALLRFASLGLSWLGLVWLNSAWPCIALLDSAWFGYSFAPGQSKAKMKPRANCGHTRCSAWVHNWLCVFLFAFAGFLLFLCVFCVCLYVLVRLCVCLRGLAGFYIFLGVLVCVLWRVFVFLCFSAFLCVFVCFGECVVCFCVVLSVSYVFL